jgi:hypothetical protein
VAEVRVLRYALPSVIRVARVFAVRDAYTKSIAPQVDRTALRPSPTSRICCAVSGEHSIRHRRGVSMRAHYCPYPLLRRCVRSSAGSRTRLPDELDQSRAHLKPDIEAFASASASVTAPWRLHWVRLQTGIRCDRGGGHPVLDAPLQLLIGGVATVLFARRGDRLWLAVGKGTVVSFGVATVLGLVLAVTAGTDWSAVLRKFRGR